MRKNRVIEQNRCYYLVSRFAHRAFFLDDEEKDLAVAGATFGMATATNVVTSAGTGLAVGAGTGALGWFSTGLTSEMSSDNCFDWGNVGSATVGGAVGGAICGAIGGAAGDALSDAANFGAESLLSGDVSLWVELGAAYSQMLDETLGKSKRRWK